MDQKELSIHQLIKEGRTPAMDKYTTTLKERQLHLASKIYSAHAKEMLKTLAELLAALGMTERFTQAILAMMTSETVLKKMLKELAEEQPETEDEIMEILFRVKGYS